jgi:peroxiredoxin
MPVLHTGDPFPSLRVDRVGGGTISLPNDLAGSFGVILIYRGSWCPYCNGQLAAFSRARSTLDDLGIKVVAFSVDNESTAAELIEKRGLTFPVGCGADADRIAEATGAYTNANPKYLQSTGFVLDPNGTIVTAVYSSGAIGRLMPDDVAGLVRYIKSHQPEAAAVAETTSR